MTRRFRVEGIDVLVNHKAKQFAIENGEKVLIAEYVLAMRHGIGLNKLPGTIHIYPTLAEANKYLAGVWKKAHAPQQLLRWVERFHGWRRG